ncbi:MAG: GMC family oxidoreductase [Alphaproteobacteria bacterium]|nr:GMC family oxidoreductase [Alphaproteobacteria bacterium]
MTGRLDGRQVRGTHAMRADVVVVGSGPAGAVVAARAAAAGARVVVVEAGPWVAPGDHAPGALRAMARSYRSMGASVVLGASPMPFVQGRMVGGSAPINGAICWRLPRDVHEGWVATDPALAEALPWPAIEAATDDVEARLGVAPTDPAIAGRKNTLMAIGAEALGLAHRPIRRNVVGCEGLGRCLQGCPGGHKQTPERTWLPDAVERGATVFHDATVDTITVSGGRARGVAGRTRGGARFAVTAERVVVAASAIQSPLLLRASGLRHGPVGDHLQCHPGMSVSGRFAAPVRAWEGATQGHEVIGLRHEGLKFEALGMGPGVLAGRFPSAGRSLAAQVADMDHWCEWGVAVRSTTHGRVRRVLGRTVVTWSATADDVARFRRGQRVLGELLFAAGAERVAPHLRGFDLEVRDVSALERLERDGPRSASAYTGAITHLFGTCRMGSDPAASVVRPDFRHHHVDGLYVADSSVFPTSLGVNPQVPIMALATLCAAHVVGAPAATR